MTAPTISSSSRQRRRRPSSSPRCCGGHQPSLFYTTAFLAISFLALLSCFTVNSITAATTDERSNIHDDEENIDYGNHNENWEDGHSSWDEFGHDNTHCNVKVLTVEEWEAGKYCKLGRSFFFVLFPFCSYDVQ